MPDSTTPEAGKLLETLPAELRAGASLWLEHLEERHPRALLALESATAGPEHALRFVAVSEFAGRHLLRDWDWFVEAAINGRLDAAPQPDWESLASDVPEDEFKRRIRLLRNRVLVHIIWRKLYGAELDETLASLSRLADQSIAACEAFARLGLEERHGQVFGADAEPVSLVILAMGKLGGGELNFSSDVDLIFLYPEGGDSDGSRSLGAQEYFARLARKVVALLGESTADGFVYRVDTRLRPFGDSGPPVVSFAALETYLLNHGRSWERYAWIKARVVVPGERHAVAATLQSELIDPFVYRRYLDFGVFESLREMKEMVSAEVRRRDMADNIKLGPGGIREIEFIVQSLQLVRGGSIRGLRTRRLRSALDCLQETGDISSSAASGLFAAYAFLRRLENFLQAIRDQQTHDLPTDETDRARLALAMGFADWAALSEETGRQRQFVSEQFSAIAFREQDEPAGNELQSRVTALCERNADANSWEQLFDEFGFDDSVELAGILAAFLTSRGTQEAGATARRRLHRLLPDLLGELRDRQQPGSTLKRLLKIVSQILRRSAYVALLNENPGILGGLVSLCEKSAYLADEVARYPLLLDDMLDPARQQTQLSKAMFEDELSERLSQLDDDDSERRIDVLAQFQRAMLFRVAAADFLNDMSVMKVSDRLTELAEVVLGEALNVAWKDLAERFGEPCFVVDGEQQVAGLGVVAYGKLGGIELSYGSDLDLVFLHNSRGEHQCTNGARELDNNVFFARLVRRLTHFLTTRTSSGALYEVDTRLRPSGRSGLLVSSIDAFERYQQENAWTWEHQALLRARPVAGDAGVAREFQRVRALTLTDGVNRDTLRQDVVKMREKMRGELDRSTAELFDLKQGAGGIGDIEFLVQYLVLCNADKDAALFHYTDNIRQLDALSNAGYLTSDEVSALQDIYRGYRSRLHQLVLNDQPPLTPRSEFADERAVVADQWKRRLGDATGNGS